MPDIADFIGRWAMARRIDDRRAGQGGRFDGEAVLAPAGTGRLGYAEAGLLRLGEGPGFAARRAYLWTFDAEGVAVAFEDGRPFHRFVPEGRGAGTDHPCGADLYRVTYDFTGWPLWRVRWSVLGPAKEYMMETLYGPPETPVGDPEGFHASH